MIRSTLLLERAPILRQSGGVRWHATSRRRRPRRRAKAKSPRNNKESSNKTISNTIQEPTILLQPVVWYSRKLDTYPLTTKCISSGLVSGVGDVLGQYIQYRKTNDRTKEEWNWDYARTSRFVILGCALVAPVCHVWYGSLMERIPGTSVKQVAKRVVLDQFCFAPLFLPTWLLNLWMLEGKSASYVMEEMPKKVPPTVVANWMLWIPAQTINLGMVPVKYQVLFSNIVAVAWSTYLSLTTHDSKKDS
jgi:peroxisomal membrane protein 2